MEEKFKKLKDSDFPEKTKEFKELTQKEIDAIENKYQEIFQ